jgi:hypothetical protein
MTHSRKVLSAVLVAAAFALVAIIPAQAAPLPDNCTKEQGQVTCTTFEGPGNNQAGVGTTTSDETQGNTTNTSPAPQDLDSTSSCRPPSSQGAPCNP